MKTLSKLFCLKNSCIILDQDETNVFIAFSEEVDSKARKTVEDRLIRYFLPKAAVFTAISQNELEIKIKRLNPEKKDSLQSPKESKPESDLMEIVKTPPVINLLNSILSEAIIKNVSDIHVELSDSTCNIRYRINGDMSIAFETDTEKGKALISRIKLLSQLNILEHRRCQDGRFSFTQTDQVCDVRVSCIPTLYGESVVMRLLGGYSSIPDLHELGFSTDEMEQILKLTEKEQGLILVSGATGNGKTTTMASILSRLNSPEKKIISVEDPVEFKIPGIIQIQVDESCGKTFSQILKKVLRHDPDILLVGEIRDKESAVLACRMALTGHLVISSVHTGKAEDCMTRLTDLGIPPFIVKDVVKGIIWQELVKTKDGKRTVKACIKETWKEAC